jgi:hypothetical protein
VPEKFKPPAAVPVRIPSPWSVICAAALRPELDFFPAHQLSAVSPWCGFIKKDVAALSFPRRLTAENNSPESSSPPVKSHLQPDDILAAPADGVAAGCARPSSRFRGISSPAIRPPTRYSTVGLTRGGACLP